MTDPEIVALLGRVADALDRLAPAAPPAAGLDGAGAFVWRADRSAVEPVHRVSRIALELLAGIDGQAAALLANTRRFARGLPANNALLWGARGMGKSSLIKAVHDRVTGELPASLALIEVHRDDIDSLGRLLALIRSQPRRCLIFCDDLSFDGEDRGYKALKALLEGGIEGRPANALFYATSNRRHLMPREMIENEAASAINPFEAVDEKVSLSDRFGLWLGFHGCDQTTYLTMIDGYARRYALPMAAEDLHREALTWARMRGARSGRVAWQFIVDLAGRLDTGLE